MGGRSGEARHAGDHAAGRALGARPGHHRAARHRVSRYERLRHVAWLAHRTLPYALGLAGQPPVAVRCELTAPDGAGAWTDSVTWRFGPPDAESAVTGTAGGFCRVAAQRLDPAQSGLRASGPHGATALVLRTYAA